MRSSKFARVWQERSPVNPDKRPSPVARNLIKCQAHKREIDLPKVGFDLMIQSMRYSRNFLRAQGTHFHVVSRIVERQFRLGDEEKEKFHQIMRRLEKVGGVAGVDLLFDGQSCASVAAHGGD